MNMEQAVLKAILPFVPHDPIGGGRAAALAVKQWCNDNAESIDVDDMGSIASNIWNDACALSRERPVRHDMRD